MVKALLLILCVLPSYGQSLKLLDTDQNWEGRIGDRIEALIKVQNVTDQPISIVIKRVKAEIGTTQINQVCFDGNCIEDNLDNLTFTKKLDPGEITTGFVSILNAGLTEEFSIVSYHIYNKDNPLDAIDFDVHYTVKEALQDDIFYESSEILLKDVYPNPVAESAFLDYQLKTEEKKAKIILHNVLGSFVGDYSLPFNENQLKINTQDLNPGVYFYTLYIDSRSITTKKFVVKK